MLRVIQSTTVMGLKSRSVRRGGGDRPHPRCCSAGRGGWICPVNLDVLRRMVHDPALRTLVEQADLVVADGMPLIWASALQRRRCPSGCPARRSSARLPAAGRGAGASIFLLGGDPGVAEAAADGAPAVRSRGEHLRRALPAVRLRGLARSSSRRSTRPSTAASPDVVFVGLGFPKQDRLILRLRTRFPSTWFVSCGISLSYLSGDVVRAPAWAQRLGLEWLHRLAQEPRRLARRYLVDGLPVPRAAADQRRYGTRVDRRVRRLIRAKAPLRVSFAGGGTDVPPFPEREGGLVLSATINRYAYGALAPREDGNIGIESVDLGLTVAYAQDDELDFDGNLDLVKAADPQARPRRLRPVPALERAAGLGPRLLLVGDRDADRAAQGVPPAAAHRLRDRRARLHARARGPRDQGRPAGPVRGDVRRLQLHRDRRRARASSTRCGSRTTSLHELEHNMLLCYTGQARGARTTSSRTRRAASSSATRTRWRACGCRRSSPSR